MSPQTKRRLWGLFYLLIAAFAAFRGWSRYEAAAEGRTSYFWVGLAAVAAVLFAVVGIRNLVVREPDSPADTPRTGVPTGGAP